MQDRINDLAIEHDGDGTFLLEQHCSGKPQRIKLHETQVRHLAVLARLLPNRDEPYATPAFVLARRLRVLLSRIDELDERLRRVSRYSEEDLEHELSYSFSTWELASEFCADVVAKQETQPAIRNEQAVTRAATHEQDKEAVQLELVR